MSKTFQIIHFYPKNPSPEISYHKPTNQLCQLFLKQDYTIEETEESKETKETKGTKETK